MHTGINKHGIAYQEPGSKWTEPHVVENVQYTPRNIAHYSFSKEYFEAMTWGPFQTQPNALFHVRAKGTPRTKAFLNFPVSGIDNRDFPCNDCDDGEMKFYSGGGPNGISTYKCNECGQEVTYP